MTRTLEQSLARAQNLRDFRFTSPKAFERSDDFRDIVNLFEEIERLKDQVQRNAAQARAQTDRIREMMTLGSGEIVSMAPCDHDSFTMCPKCNVGYGDSVVEDDHHESW